MKYYPSVSLLDPRRVFLFSWSPTYLSDISSDAIYKQGDCGGVEILRDSDDGHLLVTVGAGRMNLLVLVGC